MLKVDLHVHSNRSLCGLHSFLEILEIAKNKGMEMICISDHPRPGIAAKFHFQYPGGVSSEMFSNFGVLVDRRRVPDVINGIIVLRGIECNIDQKGDIDCPKKYISKFDLISAGFHGNIPKDQSMDYYTEIALRCIANSPIDIFTHPAIKDYPIEIGKIIIAARDKGIALELNNTTLRLGKDNIETVRKMLKIANDLQIPIVTNSDGHTKWEIGDDELIEKMIKETIFDRNLIVNNSFEKTNKFVQERKALRQKK